MPIAARNTEFEIYRTNLPHRNPEPPLAHSRPLGRWTVPSGFPSYRSDYSVSYWGPDQFRFLVLAEVNPSVVAIRARPETLEWFDGDKWIEHTPAFGVWTDVGWAYFDIANPRHTASLAVARRTRALSAGLARDGGRYRVVAAPQLAIEPRLSNSKQVNACSGLEIPEDEANRVAAAMPSTGATEVRLLGERSGIPPGQALAAVLNLAWRGEVRVDMGSPFSFSTAVWRAGP